MIELTKALKKFWSQFSYNGESIKAYRQDRVPDNAKFPYFTFEVSKGDFASLSVLNAFIWVRRTNTDEESITEAIAKILDQVEKAIPVGGVLIDVGDCGCAIYRNDANFLSYYGATTETEDETISGGMVSYYLRNYCV